MNEKVCPHGVPLRGCPDWRGGWNGGVSECGCCFTTFGFVDIGSINSTCGTIKSWQPKNRCGQCGGAYIETQWGDAT